mmetsp:Transcript_12877/g.36204  ORF Transcript_12877/g.36204 Transcript_12877/m.36204 type:complete len:790 (+) Transcript_12877:511-2880(+)
MHLQLKLVLGDRLPISAQLVSEAPAFGAGLFLDPRLKGEPLDKDLEHAVRVAEMQDISGLEQQILDLLKKGADGLDADEAGAAEVEQKVVAIVMAGLQSVRRRVLIDCQETKGMTLRGTCKICERKDSELARRDSRIKELEEEVAGITGKNLLLQKEVEELSAALTTASGEGLGANLAATKTEVAKLRAENRELVSELNENDSLVQRQMKSIAELEARLLDSPGRAGSFRSVSPHKCEPPMEDRVFLQQMAAQVHIGLGTLRSDCDALRKEAEAFRAVFPQTVMKLQSQVIHAVDTVQQAEKVAIQCAMNESAKRRALHNELVDLRGAIRCVARVRPLGEDEDPDGLGPAVKQMVGAGKVLLPQICCFDGQERSFEMDSVLGPEATQEDVYTHVKPLVQSVLDGYNICVLAYGQTGAGKTFTMEGTISSPGISGQAMSDLFLLANERQTADFSVTISVFEVYNDMVRDQMVENSAGSRLEIKQTKDGQMHIPELTELEVHSPQEVASLMRTARRNRATFATNLNKHSSRSHSILRVSVSSKCLLTGKQTVGKLQLVDLAGSERASKMDGNSARLKETSAINKSLSALGDVLYALGNKASHVPFRNSKLTYALQDSLCPGAKVLMLLAASPNAASIKETINTLNFGVRVRGVELGTAQIYVDATGGTIKRSSGGEEEKGNGGAPSPTAQPQLQGSSGWQRGSSPRSGGGRAKEQSGTASPSSSRGVLPPAQSSPYLSPGGGGRSRQSSSHRTNSKSASPLKSGSSLEHSNKSALGAAREGRSPSKAKTPR